MIITPLFKLFIKTWKILRHLQIFVLLYVLFVRNSFPIV